jgi:hypothetical protein
MKEDEMGEACSTNEEKRNLYRFFVGKAKGRERERPLGRSRHRMGLCGLDRFCSG